MRLCGTGLCHPSPREPGEVIKEASQRIGEEGLSRKDDCHCLIMDRLQSPAWRSQGPPAVWVSGIPLSPPLSPHCPRGKVILFFPISSSSYLYFENSLWSSKTLFVSPDHFARLQGLSYYSHWVYVDPLYLICSTSLFGVLPFASWMLWTI